MAIENKYNKICFYKKKGKFFFKNLKIKKK